MFDYTSDNTRLATDDGALSGPRGENIVWSHAPLQSFSAYPLSPFSYSMLAEILRRGWFNYYSRVGFEPKYGANLCRQHKGLPYLNLSISAQLEAVNAGVEPLTIRLNGNARAVVETKKRGILAGFTSGRNQRKINATLKEIQGEMDAVTQKSREWYLKTESLKWSQAEILQVMEEVERFGTDSLMAFFAARHNIDLLQTQLLWTLQPHLPFPESLELAHMPKQEIAGTIEHDLGQRIVALRAATGDTFDAALADLVERYAYRSFSDGELSLPRWGEESTPLLQAIKSETFCVHDSARKETLLQSVPSPQQKEVDQLFERLEPLYRLESEARNAFAYIQAGTRTWSKAAAQEAMSDNRIQQADDVYLFELEQIKEMMTGEWNVSSAPEIQAEADRRRAEIAAWEKSATATLLLENTQENTQENAKENSTTEAIHSAATPAAADQFWLGGAKN